MKRTNSMIDLTLDYYVQQEGTPHWPMQFSKLRRNHTACMEKYHPKDPCIHQGVYIDMLPCSRARRSRWMVRWQNSIFGAESTRKWEIRNAWSARSSISLLC